MTPMAGAAGAPPECSRCSCTADTVGKYVFFDAVPRHTSVNVYQEL
jgi:hypothetical protein